MDEIIAIIETEKVKVDIRSGQAGTLSQLFAKEGDTVAVGKPLYEIDDAGKKPEAAKVEAPQQVQKDAAPKPAAKTPPPQAAAKETKPKPPAGKAQSSEPKSIKKKKDFFCLTTFYVVCHWIFFFFMSACCMNVYSYCS